MAYKYLSRAHPVSWKLHC